jgi:hypothetical protein
MDGHDAVRPSGEWGSGIQRRRLGVRGGVDAQVEAMRA